MDEATIRNQAFFYAADISKYATIETTLTVEDILEKAEKIAKFISEGVRD